jgi:hypothetical protein
MSMGMGYGPEYARRNSAEARAELADIQANVRAERHQALLDELGRHSAELLPGAVEEIARLHGKTLGVAADPARVAVAVAEFMSSGLSARFKAPAPEADTLRKVVSRYRDRFKSDAAADAFVARHAMDLSHRPEADVVAHVVRLLHDRSSNQFLKSPVPPSPQVRRVAELMRPWSHQIATDEIELAESWGDLVDPLQARRSDVDLERTILFRLGAAHNAKHIRNGAFDPEDRRGDRAGVRRAAAQASPEQPPAPGTWAEANAAHFARSGF